MLHRHFWKDCYLNHFVSYTPCFEWRIRLILYGTLCPFKSFENESCSQSQSCNLAANSTSWHCPQRCPHSSRSLCPPAPDLMAASQQVDIHPLFCSFLATNLGVMLSKEGMRTCITLTWTSLLSWWRSLTLSPSFHVHQPLVFTHQSLAHGSPAYMVNCTNVLLSPLGKLSWDETPRARK